MPHDQLRAATFMANYHLKKKTIFNPKHRVYCIQTTCKAWHTCLSICDT